MSVSAAFFGKYLRLIELVTMGEFPYRPTLAQHTPATAQMLPSGQRKTRRALD
jgi:hypothetical protein